MPPQTTRNDAPPAYTRHGEPPQSASAGSASDGARINASPQLNVPLPGVSEADRLSMEEERLPLPSGWIRQWDSVSKHQYFVDTKATPIRSIWVYVLFAIFVCHVTQQFLFRHPLHDAEFLATLPLDQRPSTASTSQPLLDGPVSNDNAQPQNRKKLHDTDSESDSDSRADAAESSHQQSRVKENGKGKGKAEVGFGEKVKNKILGGTKEERAALKAEKQRLRQEADERKAARRAAIERLEREEFEAYLRRRQEMMRHGYGQSPFYAPPQGYAPPQMMIGGYQRQGFGPFGNQQYGHQQGRLGGGIGFGLPILGGLAGGLLLGSALDF